VGRARAAPVDQPRWLRGREKRGRKKREGREGPADLGEPGLRSASFTGLRTSTKRRGEERGSCSIILSITSCPFRREVRGRGGRKEKERREGKESWPFPLFYLLFARRPAVPVHRSKKRKEGKKEKELYSVSSFSLPFFEPAGSAERRGKRKKGGRKEGRRRKKGLTPSLPCHCL